VNHPASGMVDDEPHVEKLEAQRRNDEEVHGCDGVLVVEQEGRPPLLMTRVGRTLREIARDGGQADREPELLEFALDLPRPPAILEREAVDQLSQLPRDPRPPGPASGESAPIEPEALAVPADDGLRLDDDQRFLPARPKPLQ
jgi:hypothetical protein